MKNRAPAPATVRIGSPLTALPALAYVAAQFWFITAYLRVSGS